jgi:hypothetical protein
MRQRKGLGRKLVLTSQCAHACAPQPPSFRGIASHENTLEHMGSVRFGSFVGCACPLPAILARVLFPPTLLLPPVLREAGMQGPS